jgi:hypothetical protein
MTEFSHNADLQSLRAAIAASPIVVCVPKARDFAEWCKLQAPADIDTVILGWLRSQARQPTALS